MIYMAELIIKKLVH
jgi:hypothetical protein